MSSFCGCCWKKPWRGEGGFFFPFFSFLFCLLVCSFIKSAPIYGTGAVVCSDLYLLIHSDRFKHWMRSHPLRWAWPETPSVFSATSCFLPLPIVSTEHRSQSIGIKTQTQALKWEPSVPSAFLHFLIDDCQGKTARKELQNHCGWFDP